MTMAMAGWMAGAGLVLGAGFYEVHGRLGAEVGRQVGACVGFEGF